jgi:hypothetical protein
MPFIRLTLDCGFDGESFTAMIETHVIHTSEHTKLIFEGDMSMYSNDNSLLL